MKGKFIFIKIICIVFSYSLVAAPVKSRKKNLKEMFTSSIKHVMPNILYE